MNNKIPIFTVLSLLLLLTFAGVAFADTTITLDGTVTGDVYELTATPDYPSGSTVPPDADIKFTFPVPVRVAKDYVIPTIPYVEDWQVSIVQDAHDPRVIHLRPQLAKEGDRNTFPVAEGKLNWPCGNVNLLFNGDEVVAVDEQAYGKWEEYTAKVYQFTVAQENSRPVLLKALPEEGAVLTPKASGATGYMAGLLVYTKDITKLVFLFKQPIVLLDERKVTVRTSGPWGVYEGHPTTKSFINNSWPWEYNSLYTFPRYVLYFDAIANPGFYGPAVSGDVTVVIQPGAIKTWNGAENDQEFTIHYKVNPIEQGDMSKSNPPPPQVNEIFSGKPAEAWRVRMNGSYVTAPVKGSGHVYIGGDRLRAYTDDGALAWEVVPPGDKDRYSMPAVSDDGAIFAIYHKDGDRDYLQSYNADGTLRFSLPLPGEKSDFLLKQREIVTISYWYANDGLGFAEEMNLLRISLDGTVKAAVRITDWNYVSSSYGLLDFDAAGAIVGQKFTGGTNVAAYRVELPESGTSQDAEISWVRTINNVTDVVFKDGRIYVVAPVDDNNRRVTVFSCNGELINTIDYTHDDTGTGGWINFVHAGVVYMSDHFAVDTNTGNVERLSKSHPHDPSEYPVQVLYVDSNNNRIYWYMGIFADVWDGDWWKDRMLPEDGLIGFCLGSVYAVVGTAGSYDLVKIAPQSPPQPQPQPQPVRLEVRPSDAVINVGESAQFKAVVIYSDNTERTVTQEATWSVSTPAIASINVGLATGKTPGQTDVIATWQGLTGTAKLTVVQPQQPAPAPAPSGGGGGGTPEPKPVKLEVTPETLDLLVGDSGQLEAMLYYSDGSTRDVTYDPATAWKSDAEGVATVGNGPDGGKVTGVAAGKTDITAVYNGLSDDAIVTVRNVPPPVPPVKAVSLRVEPPETTVIVGESAQYRAIVTFSDKTEKDVTQGAAWSVSNPVVASISYGLTTGLQAGQVTVIATWQELSGTAKLIVVQPPQPAPVPPPGSSKTIKPKPQPKPVKLEVIPKALDLFIGETGQLEAVLHYSDGTTRNVTHDPATTWKSGAENIANVGNALNGGIVTGISPGSAKVTATYAGLSDSAIITVRELTGRVFGYVKDKAGNPVAGARVELRSDPRVTFSDSKGYYEFQGVPFGRHTVLITDARLEQIQRIDVILDAGGQRIVREGSDRADVQLARADREKRVDFIVVPRHPVPAPMPEKPEKKRVFWYPALLLLLLPFIRWSVNVSVEIRRDPDVQAVIYRDARGPKTVKVVAYINGDKHSVFTLNRNGQHVIGIAPDSYALVEIKTPGRRNVSRKKTATYGGVLDNVLDR